MKEITLTRGQVAIVDDADYHWLNQYEWQAIRGANGCHYAKRGMAISREGRLITLPMHRVIMGLDPFHKKQVDHINHNGLDNRRNNLRLCTQTQNTQHQRINPNRGSSKYRGVCLNGSAKKWMAYIQCKKISYYLGCFEKEQDAARAYDKKAYELFGEFAKFNFINEVLK